MCSVQLLQQMQIMTSAVTVYVSGDRCFNTIWHACLPLAQLCCALLASRTVLAAPVATDLQLSQWYELAGSNFGHMYPTDIS